MNLTSFFNRASTFVTNNTPAILTAFGVAGVFSTAYLTHKAAQKSTRHMTLYMLQHEEDYIYTKKELLELVWRYYIPPVIMGVATVSCIVGAQAVNARRQAALIGAYTVVERAYNEYKDKVVESIGEKKESEVRDKVMEERIARTPAPEGLVLSADEYLCYDALSDRYFKSDIETLRRAQNDINEQVFNDMYASLNEFYSKIGLASLPMGETMGWNIANKMDLRFTYIPDKAGRPTLALEFRNEPQMEYYKAVW